MPARGGPPGQQGPLELLEVDSPHGPVSMRLVRGVSCPAGVLMVGGIGGGFDTPARGLYDRLSAALPPSGIAALRVRFRKPGDLRGCTEDVLCGMDVLAQHGVARVALVGHSFGGAVVIRAGVRHPRVAAVCTLAAQSYGAEEAPMLAPRPLLAIHGTADPVLPATCSVGIVDRAGEPKRLALLDGAGHSFDEQADDVHDLVAGWLRQQLIDEAVV